MDLVKRPSVGELSANAIAVRVETAAILGHAQFLPPSSAFGVLDSVASKVGISKEPKRFANHQVTVATLEVLQLLIRNGGKDGHHVVRRFFAARDEDWIVPMGYAAARCLGRHGLPREVSHRLRSYDYQESDLSTDPIQILRHADEASGLADMATLFVKTAPSRSASHDLRFLLAKHAAWRRKLEAMLATTS